MSGVKKFKNYWSVKNTPRTPFKTLHTTCFSPMASRLHTFFVSIVMKPINRFVLFLCCTKTGLKTVIVTGFSNHMFGSLLFCCSPSAPQQ